MKEYLNIILGSMMVIIFTVVWGLVTTHFRSKQTAKDSTKMKSDMAVMQESQHTIDKDNALIKQQMSTMDKKMDRFEEKLEEKFDKMDRKMDNLINYLTK